MTVPAGFEKLLNAAEELLQAQENAWQAIAVESRSGNVYSMARRPDQAGEADEDAFVRLLAEKENGALRAIVCLWKSREVDVPSQRLCRLLAMLNPANGEAGILLRGAAEYHVKALKAVLA